MKADPMKAKAKEQSGGGRFAYEGLDRVIHERARLSVLTSLITHPKGVTFNDLKELCALTDGNLSRHLQEGNRPLTTCRITKLGRGRYLEYLETLERVVRDAAGAVKDEAKSRVRVVTPRTA